jgi:NAD(P)-dependent dehydrogenase (short-subunit alcohol dehydrogenase family)
MTPHPPWQLCGTCPSTHHAVLCAAGIQYVSPVEEFPEDKWDDIIAVCLNSAFHATKAALPYMHQQGWGRIINTGSMHALVASPYKSAYNAAKHGIAGFTKTVALELAQKNITCNAICPGYVLTGGWPVANSCGSSKFRQTIPSSSCSSVLCCSMPT